MCERLKGKVLLVDGFSILFRSFYAMPPNMTAPDGTHTNAVYGFLSILNKEVEEESPDHLAVAFDLPSPTFRHKLYPEYKGTRKPAPSEFTEQIPVLRSLLDQMGIPVVSAEGWEADDVLGSLAGQAEASGYEVRILSGDRDLLQTVTDSTVVVIPKTKGGQTVYEHYSPEDVQETYGVTPQAFIELKALMGDASDNVPGLPGVGEKTAQKILAQFGTIENAYAHVDELKPPKAAAAMRDGYDTLLLSKELVTIRRDAPVTFDEEAFRMGNIYTPEAYDSFKRLGFKSMLGRFGDVAVRSPSERKRAAEAGDPDSFLPYFEGKDIGVSAVFQDGAFYGACICSSDRSVFLPRRLGEDLLRRNIAEAVSRSSSAATVDAKGLLRWMRADVSPRMVDCVVAAYLLNPLKSDWNCESVASGFLNESIPAREEVLGKSVNMLTDPVAISDFALTEADVALRSAPLLLKSLEDAGMLPLFRDVEMPLTYVLASMESNGICASKDKLKEYSDKLGVRIADLTAEIYREAGQEFNINSPRQMGIVLFEKMGIQGAKRTKTGYSTAEDVLEKLAPDHPIVAHILEYRSCAKLKSTYADALADYIRKDGRIHTSFNQTITATGRLSSSDPNLQNIPMKDDMGRRIRKCFHPAEGCVFVDADYSQIELRILAHMSGDENLINAYRQSKDIHRTTASQIFHVPFEEVTDQMRRNAKAVNFGIVYGISSFGLSQGLSISRKEADEFIDQYFRTYPRIKDFLDGLISSAKEKGYAESLYGRRRPIPELNAANYIQRSFGERAAMNSPIQGTAADIIKMAMNRVMRRLSADVPDAKMVLQIHDEILIECKEADADRVADILRTEMAAAADLKVELETDCHIGRDWYEAK
ncbi:DNA polymerase I [Methanomethylophilus alvi]|uniref:DNA polymerase I n=1 Tax=Methanomethylophilus alvi TaxID=1291540 RepID=UPI0037DDA81D